MEGGCKWDWGFRRKGGEQYARISARRAGRVRREKLWMWAVERIEMRRGGDRGRRARDSGSGEEDGQAKQNTIGGRFACSFCLLGCRIEEDALQRRLDFR